MLLRQIQYFQAVIRNNSFTEAAEEYHISQSAISQQIQALEKELGVKLLERKNRKFFLTPAGEHFYRRSLVLTSDLERLRCETLRLAHRDEARLTVGYLKHYGGAEFHAAVAEFSRQYPDVQLQVMNGSHEDLYDALRFGKADVVLNDQRRAFSEEYVNLLLAEIPCFVELLFRDPLSGLDGVEIADLKNTPCVLVSSEERREIERSYYRDAMGFQGGFLFAETLQDARVLVASGQGVLPIEGAQDSELFGSALNRIPLLREGKQICRTYCAFWKKDNPGRYMEPFAALLKAQFAGGNGI